MVLYGIWNLKVPYCSIKSCKVSNSRWYWKLCVCVLVWFVLILKAVLIFKVFFILIFGVTLIFGVIILELSRISPEDYGCNQIQKTLSFVWGNKHPNILDLIVGSDMVFYNHWHLKNVHYLYLLIKIEKTKWDVFYGTPCIKACFQGNKNEQYRFGTDMKIILSGSPSQSSNIFCKSAGFFDIVRDVIPRLLVLQFMYMLSEKIRLNTK